MTWQGIYPSRQSHFLLLSNQQKSRADLPDFLFCIIYFLEAHVECTPDLFHGCGITRICLNFY